MQNQNLPTILHIFAITLTVHSPAGNNTSSIAKIHCLFLGYNFTLGFAKSKSREDYRKLHENTFPMITKTLCFHPEMIEKIAIQDSNPTSKIVNFLLSKSQKHT